MKLFKLLIAILLFACSMPVMAQSHLYKQYQKTDDVEVYYMKDYKEYAGRKLASTLVRYEGNNRIRCRQIYTQLMAEATHYTNYHMVQNKNLISSYCYEKGRVLIINYRVSLGQIDCMLLEGDYTKAEMRDFLASLSSGKTDTAPTKQQGATTVTDPKSLSFNFELIFENHC